MTRGTDSLHFFYDAQSRPAKVCFNGVMYTYVHNLQGDVTGILDNAGNIVVEYKYDAWGKLLSSAGTLVNTLGMYNPFRYKGCVYDVETEQYYLKRRYYRVTYMRFINADGYIGKQNRFNEHNMFIYCLNDPILGADYNGCSFINSIISFAKNIVNVVKTIIKKVKESASTTKIIGSTFTSKGKAYKIYNPSNYPSVTIGPPAKTIASGSASKGFFQSNNC